MFITDALIEAKENEILREQILVCCFYVGMTIYTRVFKSKLLLKKYKIAIRELKTIIFSKFYDKEYFHNEIYRGTPFL